MLYALHSPVSLAGLLTGFLLALAVRVFAIRGVERALRLNPYGRRSGFNPRYDVDPFGAVAAVIGGLGWGRPLDVGEVSRHRGRGAFAAVFAAGPLATLLLAQLLLLAFALIHGNDTMVTLNRPSDALAGVAGDAIGPQFLLSLAAAVLCFAVFTLLPVPPLDGFGLLWACFRTPGPGIAKYKHWFADNNVGVAVLLGFLIIPFLRVPLLLVIDAVAGPLMRVWT